MGESLCNAQEGSSSFQPSNYVQRHHTHNIDPGGPPNKKEGYLDNNCNECFYYTTIKPNEIFSNCQEDSEIHLADSSIDNNSNSAEKTGPEGNVLQEEIIQDQYDIILENGHDPNNGNVSDIVHGKQLYGSTLPVFN